MKSDIYNRGYTVYTCEECNSCNFAVWGPFLCYLLLFFCSRREMTPVVACGLQLSLIPCNIDNCIILNVSTLSQTELATRHPVIHSSWGGKAPIKEPLLPGSRLYTAVGVGRLPSRNLCYQAACCTQQLGWEGSHQGTSATRQLVVHSSWGGKAPIKEPLLSSYHKQ